MLPGEGRRAARGSRCALTRVPLQVDRVPCPYDAHHRVPRASLERHAASCRLRKMGYSAEEQVGWEGRQAGASGRGAATQKVLRLGCRVSQAEMYDSRFFYENLKVPTVAMGKHTGGRQSAGGLHGGGITAWLRKLQVHPEPVPSSRHLQASGQPVNTTLVPAKCNRGPVWSTPHVAEPESSPQQSMLPCSQ